MPLPPNDHFRRTPIRAIRRMQAAPIIAMALVLVLLGAFLWILERNERHEAEGALQNDALWAGQSLSFQLYSDQDRLRRLAEQLAADGEVIRGHDLGQDRFAALALQLVGSHPAIASLTLLDEQGQPLTQEPPVSGGGSVAIGNQKRDQVLAAAFQAARLSGQPAYSAPYPGAAGNAGQGEAGESGQNFDIVVPIIQHDQLVGGLAASLSFSGLLSNAVPWWFAQRYELEVVDRHGAILGAKWRLPRPEGLPSHAIPFEPPGHELRLLVSARWGNRDPSRLILIGAIGALTITALWSFWALRRHSLRRVRAEEAWRTEQAFRKAMEDSLTVGMRARDMEGRIIYVNPAFCRMVGWSAEELIGRTPPMPYWLEEEGERADPVATHGMELRFRRADGETIEALVYEAPLINANGRQTGWMGSVLDITERKHADDMNRQQQEGLQQTARLITMGEMASTLAHELNQPLSAIASYCTGCLNKLNSGDFNVEELSSALDKAAGQARRAGLIIRRVHDFVRKSEPNVVSCVLKDTVQDCVALLGVDAKQHGVRFELRLDADLPSVAGDRILLQQVLINLMRNGIEAMAQTPRERRRLTITLERGEGLVLIGVADQGPGIAPSNVERLFTPFFTTKAEGMGMGLNICRSIIEHHQGRLWFEPGAEGGTMFWISLPSLSEQDAAELVAVDARPGDGQGRNREEGDSRDL